MANQIRSFITRQNLRIKKLLQGERQVSISPVWSWVGSDLPDYSNLASLDTAYRIWKDIPAVRATVRAKVNACLANGFVIKTLKEGDNNQADKRVIEITRDFRNPKNKFYTTMREWLLNMAVFHSAGFETGSKGDNGFIFALDRRKISPKLNTKGTKVGSVVVDDGSEKGRALGEGKFVYSTFDTFGMDLTGNSNIEALKWEANIYAAAIRHNYKQFISAGVPPLLFILEDGSWDEYRKLQEKIKGVKAGSNLSIKGKIKVERLGTDMRDMEYGKMIDNTTNSTMSVMQVPPIMMAQAAGSQGETDRQQMNAFGAEVAALQRILQEAIAQAIVHVYGDTYADIYMELGAWVDKRQEAAIHRSNMNIGVVTVNEVRAQLDLPAISWGNIPYNPNFLGQIIGKVDWMQEKEEPKEEDEDEDQEEESEEGKPDPSQNEGNTGEEKPSGQNRDEVKKE